MAPVSSGKSLLDRVEERGKFPGVRQRYCTGDFKRTPIERELRRHLKANPRFGGRLINCLGIRRDESAARAKRVPWRRNERLSVAGREVFDWLPIFDLATEDVFRVIRDAGQSPHWIYRHLSRCSCSFCVFSSPEDLRRAHGRFAVRARRRRGHDGSRPPPIPAGAAAAAPRTAQRPQASVSEEWSGAGVRVNPGARWGRPAPSFRHSGARP